MLRATASSSLLAVVVGTAAGCGHAQRSDGQPEGRATTENGTLVLACSAAADDCAPQTKSYAVQAHAGQTLTVALSPQDGRVIISDILDPHRQSAIPTDADERFWFGWTVEVKEPGEFLVTVSTTETATTTNPYTLRVTLR